MLGSGDGALAREVVARAADPKFDRWREQVAQTGYCARPVRLKVWSPDKSPATLQPAEVRLRLHLRPTFGPRRLDSISALLVERWQKRIASDHGHETVLACRSLLNRILKAAVKDRRLALNPVREVDPPPKPVDAERRLGNAKRRTFSPVILCTPDCR